MRSGLMHCLSANNCHLLWSCSCHGNPAGGIRPTSSFSNAINPQLNAEALWKIVHNGTVLMKLCQPVLGVRCLFETQCTMVTVDEPFPFPLWPPYSPLSLYFFLPLPVIQSGAQGQSLSHQWLGCILCVKMWLVLPKCDFYNAVCNAVAFHMKPGATAQW